MRNGSPRSGGATLGAIVGRGGRFIWRVLPLTDHARVRLRTAILRWLRLENEAIDAPSTTRQLQRVASRMSPRWLWKGMALLLRGETSVLKQHVASIVQHEVNAEHRARQAEQQQLEDASRPSAEARDRARAAKGVPLAARRGGAGWTKPLATRLAILAAGHAGDPSSIPWLIE